jgi:7-cyano-7-deazaguanine synthase
MQSSFDLYTDGCIRIGVPFIKWNKRMIWDYCKTKKIPLEITYSCELGQDQPCGQCLSCKDLEALHVS